MKTYHNFIWRDPKFWWNSLCGWTSHTWIDIQYTIDPEDTKMSRWQWFWEILIDIKDTFLDLSGITLWEIEE